MEVTKNHSTSSCLLKYSPFPLPWLWHIGFNPPTCDESFFWSLVDEGLFHTCSWMWIPFRRPERLHTLESSKQEATITTTTAKPATTTFTTTTATTTTTTTTTFRPLVRARFCLPVSPYNPSETCIFTHCMQCFLRWSACSPGIVKTIILWWFKVVCLCNTFQFFKKNTNL